VGRKSNRPPRASSPDLVLAVDLDDDCWRLAATPAWRWRNAGAENFNLDFLDDPNATYGIWAETNLVNWKKSAL